MTMAQGAHNTARWLVLAAGGCAALSAGALASLAARSQDGWLVAAVTDRVFVMSAAVFAVSLILGVVLASALWQAGRPMRQVRPVFASLRRGRPVFALRRFGKDERGAAIVEFALVLPFLLMLALLMAQSALLMVGNVVVHYAAHCAVRTAVVAAPLDLADSGAPRNVVPEFGVKYSTIRESALWAVTPISCGSRMVPAAACDDIQRGIEFHWASNNLSRPRWLDIYGSLPHRVQYAADNTTVTVRPPADGYEFAEREDIIVDVSHVFYMGVPYAGRLLSALMGQDGRSLSAPEGSYGVVLRATSRLPNEGPQDFIDIERFAGWR
ncbi:MAG: pilus assembly protein [Phycisphaerae bacterium]|nr:pilus assembly protein [Phycisphaerae bacterium]